MKNMIKLSKTKYLSFNASLNKRMIFRLGYDAGFYSEFNGMVLAVVYCIKNNIRFEMNSSYSNFKIQKGWDDYFEPFFKENNLFLNKYINYRPYNISAKNIKLEKRLKKIFNIDLFTQDIWNDIRSTKFWNSQIVNKDLGINETLLQTGEWITSLCYNFKPKVQESICKVKNDLCLPEEYIGIHIRRGDKIKETQFINIESYFELATRLTHIRSVFISTDDYRTILEIKNKYQEWRIFYDIDVNASGYDQNVFSRKLKRQKFKDLIYLFSNVETLSESKIFIGTISTNIGMFVGMRRGNEKCYYLDSDSWRVI